MSHKLLQFLINHPHFEIYQATTENGKNHSGLKSFAKKIGLDIKSKPDSINSAMIITSLLNKGYGTRVSLSKVGIKFHWRFHSDNTTNVEKIKIEKSCIDDELTPKQVIRFLNNQIYVKNIVKQVGFGKEASVFLIKNFVDEVQIAKVFRTYNPIARKIKRETFKLKTINVPILMAKNELKNLSILESHGLAVPRVIDRDGHVVLMEPVYLKNDNEKIAQPLSTFKLKNLQFDLDKLIELIFDPLLDMLEICEMVHRDYSHNNLLFDGEKLIVIDVAQASKINFNTFTHTKHRLCMDEAITELRRDISSIISYFARNRIYLDEESILENFLEVIP